ncbi:MAG: hypothetical protein ABIG39_06940 [Candidatus Micrarchaeota archaeon]
MAKFHSAFFGETRDAELNEVAEIERLVSACPHAVFATLNKKLNFYGFHISIEVLKLAKPTTEEKGDGKKGGE